MYHFSRELLKKIQTHASVNDECCNRTALARTLYINPVLMCHNLNEYRVTQVFCPELDDRLDTHTHTHT